MLVKCLTKVCGFSFARNGEPLRDEADASCFIGSLAFPTDPGVDDKSDIWSKTKGRGIGPTRKKKVGTRRLLKGALAREASA
ncbi:hypothetical protein BHE74_00000732 [Ensete ventricosum]|nr:hypothetical protein BHE74_00000732 [Ensete ventricosum]